MEREYEDLKIKFLKIYAKIPEKIREESIIVVVDDKPYTWNNAVIAIKTDSELGAKILNTLKKVGLL